MPQHSTSTDPTKNNEPLNEAFANFNLNRIAKGYEPYTFEQYNEVIISTAALIQSKPTRQELEAIVMPSISQLISEDKEQ